MRECYNNNNNITCIKENGNNALDILNDLDNILLTNVNFMLGPWILLARNGSNDTDTRNWLEYNAKNQLTLWGPHGEINNYAAKDWGNLIGDYHVPQWKLFMKQFFNVIDNNEKWNNSMQNQFEIDNYNQIEAPWQTTLSNYPVIPQNDTIIVACDIYKKWNMFGDKSCT
eukprot:320339_1